ncbi:MAG: hypothetical protein Sylvanvirus10_33 [Sylvanvirus sp.]|uniref:Uncharacterized protein n=1 Tax=Sylvanvirus sp. TaxID=2487774 RepID=A0A3G5AI43_9VIRU|nr:MAG: hypothetical protein Sylvanvirus10_33 [Sylvanvirus sp.]
MSATQEEIDEKNKVKILTFNECVNALRTLGHECDRIEADLVSRYSEEDFVTINNFLGFYLSRHNDCPRASFKITKLIVASDRAADIGEVFQTEARRWFHSYIQLLLSEKLLRGPFTHVNETKVNGHIYHKERLKLIKHLQKKGYKQHSEFDLENQIQHELKLKDNQSPKYSWPPLNTVSLECLVTRHTF